MDGKVHDGASHQQPELDPENIVGAGGECTSAVKSGGALCSEVREHRNWLIYELYVRQEHAECLNVINEQLEEYGDVCEYALFVKGLLSRRTGELTASLEHFSKVLELSPMNPHYLRQVGQAQFLLRKYSEAIEKLQQAEQAREAQGLRKDWSLQYGIGLCYEYSKEYRKAEEAFRNSLRIQQFDCTVIRLSNILTIQG
ncbi:Bardet-Biedl syndrome 4 protein homolog (BBS4-like protein 4), putative, partial [Trypanosoma congolense IL3000]